MKTLAHLRSLCRILQSCNDLSPTLCLSDTFGHVNQRLPDLLLRELRPLLGVLVDTFENIATTGIFHDHIEGGGGLVIKGVLVADDIVAIEAG